MQVRKAGPRSRALLYMYSFVILLAVRSQESASRGVCLFLVDDPLAC